MAIYAVKIPGRNKRVLVKASNQTEAAGRFLSVELLTNDKMQEALDEGEAVWREGAPFPADEPEPEAGTDDQASESEAK